MIKWITDNYIEIFGAVSGLLYIYFSIKQNIFLWLTGLISCAVYVYVFYISKLYADMGLQAYYVAISIYGWYNWKKGKISKSENLPIIKLDKKIAIYSFLAVIILFAVIGFLLDHITDSQVPYWDAFVTSLGIVGTWMLAKKYIEQWLIWILANFISIFLFLYKDLYPTSILYLVYMIMAIVGYIQWSKSMKKQTIDEQQFK